MARFRVTAESLCSDIVANDPSKNEFYIFSFGEYDDMTSIFAAIEQNTVIETIKIDCTTFRQFPGLSISLAAALMNHPSIKSVTFFRYCPTEFGPIALAFQQNEQLSNLIFDGCDEMSQSTLVGLGFMVQQNSLESLKVTSCREKAWTLPESFERNRSLKELCFSETSLTDEGLRILCRFIQQNQTLQSLRFDTGLFYELSVDMTLMIHCVLSAVRGHLSLQEFVWDNDDEDDSINGGRSDIILEELGIIAQTAPKLRSLHFTHYDMEKDDLRLLLKGFRHKDCHVEELNLTETNVDASILADFLRTDCKLKTLSLEGNDYEEKEVSTLASALKQNSCLESLCLEENYIGNEGAAALAAALVTNTSLKHLNILQCGIGNEGITSICEMLKTNTTLERLCVGGKYDAAAASSIVESLPYAKGLKHLEVFHLTKKEDSKFVANITNIMESHDTLLERVDFRYGRLNGTPEKKRLDHLLQLNAGGKRILKANNVPDALWSRILARSSKYPDVLYFFLREKSGILCRREEAVTTGKRKRDDSD